MTDDAPSYGRDDAQTPTTGTIDLVAVVQALSTRIEALEQRLTNAEYMMEHQVCPVQATITDIRAVLAARWPL